MRRVAAAAALTLLLAGCGNRVDPDTAVADARELFEEGKAGEARILLKNALAKVPALPGAREELARIALRENDPTAAWDELRALDEAAAAEPDAVALRVRAALELGNLDEASRLLARHGGALAEPESSLLRARLLRGQGQGPQALTLLRDAQKAHPENAEVSREIAGTLATMGNLSAAIAELDRQLAGSKSDADSLMLRGRMRMAQRQFAEALKDLRAAADAAPPEWTRAQRIGTELVIGDALLAAGDKDGLRAQLDKLQKQWPGMPGTEVLAAQLLQLEGNYGESAKRLQALAEAMPGNERLQRMLAEASVRTGDTLRATALLEKLAPKLPPEAPERRMLATLWMQQGRPDRALEALGGGDAEARLAAGDNDQLLASVQLARSRVAERVAALSRDVASDPGNVSLLADLALAQVSNGQIPAAMTTLSRVPAGKDNPQSTAARMMALLAAGNEIEANRLVDRLLDPDSPGDFDTLVAAADAAQRQSRGAIAGRLLDRAATLDAKNVEVTLRQASLAFDAQRHDDAQRMLQGILAADPKHMRASLALARVQEARGDVDGARKTLQAALAGGSAEEPAMALVNLELRAQRVAEANKVLDTLVAAKPDGSAANAAGLLLAQNGHTAEAQARFRQATSQAASNAIYWYNLGNAELALENRDAALAAYQRSAELQPALLPAAAGAARLSLAKKDNAGANRIAAAATQADPRSVGAWLLRGHVALAAGDNPAAAEAYARASALRPNAASAVGEFRARQQGRLPRPDAPVLAWLAREPGDSMSRRLLGEHYLAEGNASAARQQLETVLKTAPNDVVSLNNLAWLLRTSDATQAEAYARQAYAIAPGNGAIADTLGSILSLRGKHEEALPLLESASNAQPDNRTIQYHYAQALHSAGRDAPAREALQRALDGGAQFPERAEAQRLKEELK